MSRLNDIEKLRGWCHKVLPLVYDDSLSYYEVLCKVRAKINEVITLTAEQNEVIEDAIQEITDWETTTDDKYNQFVAQMDEAFDNFKNTVNQNFENYEERLNQEFEDFVHLFVDEFDRNTPYSVGEYVEYEGQMYKCTALPSPSHGVPIEFDEYTWLRISDGVISQFSREMMAMDGDIKEFVERMVPLYSENEYYNKDMIVRTPSVFAPSFPYDFYIAKQLIEPEPWTPAHWERVNSFAQAVNDVGAINKYEMQEQFDQFLEDYQRQFGVVQDRGSSTTDVMSQKAVSDELEEIDNTFNDIESGQEVVGHASVADNLTPYSEDSGAIQDAPFISQGTGTNNNTDIVTTGDRAKQLEKLGNAPVVNQWLNPMNETRAGLTSTFDATKHEWHITGTTTGYAGIRLNSTSANANPFAMKNGHTYLVLIDFVYATDTSNGSGLYVIGNTTQASNKRGSFVFQATENHPHAELQCIWNTTNLVVDCTVKLGYVIDLTQWDFTADQIADLTANPSHFSWYYNGSLAYNEGSIEHGNGVKLVCTRGRNLFNKSTAVVGFLNSDGTIDSAQTAYKTSDFILVTPNVSYWLNATYSIRGKQYDKNKQPLNTSDWDTGDASGDRTFDTAPNCVYVRFSYVLQYEDNQCLTPYYTEQQGGEGYGESYPYEEPDIINTGSEPLGAFDKKTPDGVITRASLNANLYELYWRKDGNYWYTLELPAWLDNTNAKSNKLMYGGTSSGQPTDASKWYTSGGGYLEIYAPNAQSSEDVQILLAGVDIEYKSSNPTTEQGSSYSQYAGINDYGIMYWLGINDELISIPQGCKIQYPVNYKGFTDDLYMYTHGDATSLAKNDSITDAALTERGYLKLTALSGYDSTKTQTLKNVQGVFTWVDD